MQVALYYAVRLLVRLFSASSTKARCMPPSPALPKAFWATLVTSPDYLAGCLTLHHSLVRHNSAYPLVVYATDALQADSRAVLDAFGIRVVDVDFLEPVETVELSKDFQRFHMT